MITLGSGDIVLGVLGGGVVPIAFVPRTGDLVIPIVDTFSPLDGASSVTVDVNLVIIFNEDIRKGTGNITIKRTSNDSVVETIDVTGELVGISGDVVTINPSSDLPSLTDCYILIDSGALGDLSANDYAGISAKTVWNFTTADVEAPTVGTLSPLDEAVDVSVSANLVVTFDENVQKGTGNITIKKTSDDSTVETIDVTTGLVGISSAVATINPASDLPGATGCYILIDSGAFKDMSNNDHAGISLKTVWNFTVETTFSGTISTFGNLTPDATHKWVGGAVAANGSIYGAPYLQGSILKVITSTEVTSEIGSYSDTWCGGAYDTVNGCVYFAPYGPYGAKDVLKIDSSDDSVSTHAVSGELANGAWFGLVRAANGYIYGIPYSATTVLKIDPSDDSISVIGNLSGAGKWMYGILADNGCIYGVPYYATTILKIDTSDDTISTFGSLSGNAKWSGGVFVSANGCIYCAPFNSTVILKIDTSDDSTSTFGSYSGDFKWSDACLAADDIIYCIPYNSTTVLKIDPSDDSSSITGSLSGEKKWGSGVVAPNGNIYGITRYITTMLKIE